MSSAKPEQQRLRQRLRRLQFGAAHADIDQPELAAGIFDRPGEAEAVARRCGRRTVVTEMSGRSRTTRWPLGANVARADEIGIELAARITPSWSTTSICVMFGSVGSAC